MSLGKTLSLGILALGILGIPAQADPINSMSESGQWTFWSQSSNSTIGTPTYATDHAPAPSPPPSNPEPNVPNAAPAPPPQAPAVSFASSEPSASGRPDAFINFGNGPYEGANLMTTGTIQPWYESPTVTQAFGGVPSAQQQADFTNSVLRNVEQTFQQSGIDVNLSLDPNSQAPHTLSVVSGASYGPNANAIGIAEVGGSGFSFLDKLNYGNSIDQLAWVDAHNIAHELMHSFGVSTHHDQTGTYLDAATASWDMLASPDTKFSPEATEDLKANLASNRSGSGSTVGAEMLGTPASHTLGCHCPLCERGYMLETLGANPVPEPTTMALWAAGALVSVLTARRRRAKSH